MNGVRGMRLLRPMSRLFLDQAAARSNQPALRVLASGGAAVPRVITWGEWERESLAFAAALVESGIEPGAIVAILAGNGVEWPIADLGILLAGCVSAGVFPTSSAAQVCEVLADCGAVAVVTDSRAQTDKIHASRAQLPALRTMVGPTGSINGTADSSWADWLARGRVAHRDPVIAGEIVRRISATGIGDPAILIYTSGSTGVPKGATLSHAYLHASALSIRDALGLVSRDTALSFLPFSHAAERVFGHYTRIVCGMEAGLVADHTRVWAAAADYGPTLFGGLPRFYEKVYESVRAQEERAQGEERERWAHVLQLGRERARWRRSGAVVPIALDQEWRRIGQPMIERVLGHFGNRVRVATSGGAKLPEQVGEYLDALGLTVLGAYGLTEHLCATMHRPDHYNFDSAGVAMPGTTIRIAEDGEVLLKRNALTFSGYLGRPEESRAAFDASGEWLHTGDFGTIDDAGFLHVTGRKKELIALSTGKKVAPLRIEAKLTCDPWISQALLLGEGRKYIAALLTLRREVVESWAGEHGLPRDYAELLCEPAVIARVQAAIDTVNAEFSGPEQIRRFRLLEHEFTFESGELTPTLKIRRALVTERFRSEIEALYAGGVE